MYGFAYNYKKLQIYTYERMPCCISVYICVCVRVCVCVCVVHRVSEYMCACKYMLVNLCMVLHTIIKKLQIYTYERMPVVYVCIYVCV